MSCSKTTWDFALARGGSLTRVITFEDETGTPVDFTHVDSVVMLVKTAGVNSEEILWSEQFEILSPKSDGKIRFTLTDETVTALTFKSARFFVFFVAGDARSEEHLSGTILVK